MTARLWVSITGLGFLLSGCQALQPQHPHARYLQEVDELYALWSQYKYAYVKDGRVFSPDEGEITTSEGQGYALLRAVWANDRDTFERVWLWTLDNLMVREDHLFAWKWKGQVLDRNTASDADADIALALLLAARRFSAPRYERKALGILADIWSKEVVRAGSRYFLTAGDWAPHEEFPTLHVAYLAPYAYEVFARADPEHPWQELVRTSYEVLHWIYFAERLDLPPEVIYLDRETGELYLEHPRHGRSSLFSYDAFPIFWRVALDYQWFWRREGRLREAMLEFFKDEWQTRGKFLDRYALHGAPRSQYEGLPLYATVQALALVEDQELAEALRSQKLAPLWQKAEAGEETPYYLHNWLWFGRAFDLRLTRTYDEFLGFLRPFDFQGFSANFPWMACAALLALFCLGRWERLGSASKMGRIALLAVGLYLCFRYLYWRLFYSLNFAESFGPFISICLWVAEFYSFSTVVLLLVQVGIDPRYRRQPAVQPGFFPSVDIFVPIYSEPLAILEKTLAAARAIRYPDKKIFVLDDSRSEQVRELAERHGVGYLRGPRKHAKAGNLNHALGQTCGELVAVFDTDHIPVSTFLQETVPHLADPQVGLVQTPHHFYNPDIFQRMLQTDGKVPNEQDLFNHRIQGGRDRWNGAFFVGSGAVFRRQALESIGGFKLLSITEDIHTSQHLHAAGWQSVFVDKDLAAGLTAETLSAHIGQRRRWMLGCLQVFFRDNPLWQKGLGLRHRIGYFASLYYFFFPLARMVYWATPLYYLLFHLHPILSELSVLLAYLVPYLVALPAINRALLNDWPRLWWGTAYEQVVCFPLFRSIFDLFLPSRLGFKVTPKGVVSQQRRFDFRSAWLTLLAAAITAFALVKGLEEVWYFGIEKDAYFFNLVWAAYNLALLLIGLLMAWERPQRRREVRLERALPVRLSAEDFDLECRTHDLSLEGMSLVLEAPVLLPPRVEVALLDADLVLGASLVYNDQWRGRYRCGFRFENPLAQNRLLLRLFSAPDAWAGAHRARTRSSLGMGYYFFLGMLRALLPLRPRRRLGPRQIHLWPVSAHLGGKRRRLVARDVSNQGLSLWFFGKAVPDAEEWIITELGGEPVVARRVYVRQVLPYWWRVGLRREATPPQSAAMSHEEEGAQKEGIHV